MFSCCSLLQISLATTLTTAICQFVYRLVMPDLLERMQDAQQTHSYFLKLTNVKWFLPLSTASLKPLDFNNLLGTFSFSLVEPTFQRENLPSKTRSRNNDKHQPLTPRYYLAHLKILQCSCIVRLAGPWRHGGGLVPHLPRPLNHWGPCKRKGWCRGPVTYCTN